ncbi:serine hydrolase domain-containing protein [Xinfangfangia pollutisoli]|uniref:serine hydrolase domain-containing protein n=1 Tax=Xinfangfangia pollutisoli TaxID=2865960 RepID=UPI001CD6981A|nr:serine hydrolase domain-containing protein [Xinfangfangia pollutisoli]
MTSDSDGLPRRAPSSRGTDPAILAAVLDTIRAEAIELHSLLIWQKDALILDAWWAPFAPARPHMMHSVTKSFTSAAVGLALAEGRLALDDLVLGFFPDHPLPDLPAQDLARLQRMTLRHLLTMASGHGRGISGGSWRRIATSWVADFLRQPMTYEPGEVFVYDSAASYMLSAIVQRATGRQVLDLLDERIFRPMQMSRAITWDIGPDGVNTGGNGLSCTTADLLKLGILHLQGGQWQGQQLLPADWVAQATAAQLRNVVMGAFTGDHYLGPEAAGAQVREGYGYQWWRGPHDSFSANGLFGQYCIALPDQCAVVAFTGGLDDDDDRMHRLIYDRLRPALGAGGGDAAGDAALAAQVAGLHLATRPRGPGAAPAQIAARAGTWQAAPNDQQITQIGLAPGPDGLDLWLVVAGQTHRIAAGYAHFVESRCTLPGARLHHSYQPPEGLAAAACACWSPAADLLTLDLVLVETAFRDTIEIAFDGEDLRLSRRVNVNSAARELPAVTARRLSLSAPLPVQDLP